MRLAAPARKRLAISRYCASARRRESMRERSCSKDKLNLEVIEPRHEPHLPAHELPAGRPEDARLSDCAMT